MCADFPLVSSPSFSTSSEGAYLHSRNDKKLFSISTNKTKVLDRELLFADNGALVSHTDSGLQSLAGSFSDACHGFGLKINLT